MKCIREKKTGVIYRLPNPLAVSLVESGDYSPTSKGAWRKQVKESIKIFKNRKRLMNKGFDYEKELKAGNIIQAKDGTLYFNNTVNGMSHFVKIQADSKSIDKVRGKKESKQLPKIELKYKSLEKYRESIIEFIDKKNSENGKYQVTVVVGGTDHADLESSTIKGLINEIKSVI